MNSNVKIAKSLLKIARTLVSSGSKAKAYCHHNGQTFDLSCAIFLGTSHSSNENRMLFVDDSIIDKYRKFSFPNNAFISGLLIKNGDAFACFHLYDAEENWLVQRAEELGYELVDSYDELFK